MDESIFDYKNNDNLPLAEKMRPKDLSGFVGQDKVIGKDSVLKNMIENNNLSSFIFWGPPGSGKTTLAKIISSHTDANWVSISAVLSGIKDAKQIMDDAKNELRITGKRTILFIDEIHRFNKAQQDAFLPYVEEGTIILIGATTENPSFSIISPLLSRMRVIILKQLSDDDIIILINRAVERIKKDDKIIIEIDDDNIKKIAEIANGDARRAYGILELCLKSEKKNNKIEISKELIEKVIQGRLPSYDKKGDAHYDHISALHKSMRNSDVNAAIYYTSKMLEAGEDPLYIIRRVIQHSSEDIGMADPNALIISIAARDAILALGMPEATLSLLEAVVYNALAPKSNALLNAVHAAREDIKKYPDIPIPIHLRNAPTKLMKEIGYGKDYQYAHNYDIPVTSMQCLPDELKNSDYYKPSSFGFEKTLKERIEKINKIKKSQNNQE